MLKNGEKLLDDVFVEEMGGKDEAEDEEEPEPPLPGGVRVQPELLDHLAAVERLLDHLDE